jgi:hypothetical protein
MLHAFRETCCDMTGLELPGMESTDSFSDDSDKNRQFHKPLHNCLQLK